VEGGVEAGDLRHVEAFPAQVEAQQVARQVQRGEMEDVLQARTLGVIHHARGIDDLAAVHETMADDVGLVAGQVAHQFIEGRGMVAQMVVAEIAARAVRGEQAALII
jgi:hypothetical protein